MLVALIGVADAQLGIDGVLDGLDIAGGRGRMASSRPQRLPLASMMGYVGGLLSSISSDFLIQNGGERGVVPPFVAGQRMKPEAAAAAVFPLACKLNLATPCNSSRNRLCDNLIIF